MTRILEIIRLGIRNIVLHKLRSFLTTLGIIFGVAAVISMLAIGEGAKWEALQQIELLGVQNITVRSVKPPQISQREASSDQSLSYGLTEFDRRHIEQTVGPVEIVVPVKEVRHPVFYGDRQLEARVVGTTPDYTGIINFHVGHGRFVTELDNALAAAVCVIGAEVRRELFGYEHPIGKHIRIGQLWFEVVGIMEDKAIKGTTGTVKVHNLDRDIYIPYKTAHTRFGDWTVIVTTSSREYEMVQITELIIRIRDTALIPRAAWMVQRILAKNHARTDYDVIIPQALLEQRKRTIRTYNNVLVLIGSISLLVGGIGIMNIMLATVTERTREIGVRRAMGARRVDIVQQFLIETVVLSAVGGLVGILGGVVIAQLVQFFAQQKTIITAVAIIISAGISIGVGIVFGLHPAVKAARMDPIEALRYE
ncbi:MAG: ABC transporter permease [Verrucomicrobia bacterium]|nr:ABC transporter permease [Verrucomicrobiota bacterium]